MAESVKVIDPNSGAGYDYDSLYDWEAAQQADIDTSNTIAVAKCRCTGGTADTTAVTIDGWTTSATDYIKIWTDPAEGYRHNGSRTTGNCYRLHASVAWAVAYICSEDFVRFYGIQFSNTNINSYGAFAILCSSSSSLVLVDSCLFYGVQYSGGYGFASVNSGILSVFTNCNVFGNGVDKGFTVLTAGTPITAYFYNCNSVNNGSYGFYCSDFRSIVCKNCYSGGNGTADYYKTTNGTFTLTTCRSEDGTLSTTQAAFSTSSGCYFTNVTAGSENLHIGASSELIGAATNLYNDATWSFQIDIDAQDRGGAAAAWDIGADEYVSAVTDLSIFASECVGSEGVFG